MKCSICNKPVSFKGAGNPAVYHVSCLFKACAEIRGKVAKIQKLKERVNNV